MTLTIKNAPDYVVKRLRERAQKNHRSLQGELLSIVEDAAMRSGPLIGNREFFARIDAIGLKSKRSDSARMIREDRDSR